MLHVRSSSLCMQCMPQKRQRQHQPQQQQRQTHQQSSLQTKENDHRRSVPVKRWCCTTIQTFWKWNLKLASMQFGFYIFHLILLLCSCMHAVCVCTITVVWGDKCYTNSFQNIPKKKEERNDGVKSSTKMKTTMTCHSSVRHAETSFNWQNCCPYTRIIRSQLFEFEIKTKLNRLKF